MELIRSLLPPSASAFPRLQLGRLLHYQFRDLLSVHSPYNLQTRQVALCATLHRSLRRLCCLHCRFDWFYEKVIKVKADVAAHLTFLVLCGLRHISTESFARGSLRSDDWQIGRPTAPPRFVCFARLQLFVFRRCHSPSVVTCGAVEGAPKGAFILTLDRPASHFTIELGTKR